MWGPFHNRSGVIVSCMEECMEEYLCANIQSLVTKQPIFVTKRNSIEKETSEIFDCTR